MSRVAVIGAADVLGGRVLRLLAADPDVDAIVAVDIRAMPPGLPKTEVHRADITRADLPALLAGVDVVVHLAVVEDTERRRARAAVVNVWGTGRLLEAASEVGVQHVVFLSSATVYGAWPNNAVPLTEDAPLRPNPELAYAVQRAQAEQLLADWVDAPNRTVAVLRPCVALAEDGSSWIARSLAAAAGVRRREDDPPKQFLHLDDLASAVDVARRERLDGVFNVAPDGWLTGDLVRELSGAPPRVPLTSQAAARFDQLRWRFQRGPIPPGLLPFTTDPWVIANDRLVGCGWKPEWTNEEAYVAGTEAKWWTMMSPKRKQELALGLMGVLVAAFGLTTALIVRRAWRRARARRAG